MKREWYIVHTYSGYENKVKDNLEKRVETMEMQDKIFQVEVCLLYTSPSPRDRQKSRMPSSA